MLKRNLMDQSVQKQIRNNMLVYFKHTKVNLLTYRKLPFKNAGDMLLYRWS